MRFALASCAAVAVWTLLSGYAVSDPTPRDAVETEIAASDEKLLKDLNLPTDGPALLNYFRKRTFSDTNPRQMAMLVQQLGNEDFRLREKAYSDILALGAGAVFGLRQAEGHRDTEVKRRAVDLRLRIEEKPNAAIQAAAARLIGQRKPAGAAEVLLGYLPFAADDTVTDELCRSLSNVAVHDGKPDSAVVQALEDRQSVKRGAAAEALVRARVASELPAVRQLLKDPEPKVRLRTALALAHHREKEAVPVLIELLAVLPPEQLWPTEEALIRVAGEQAPTVSLGIDENTRKQARDAWSGWWLKHGNTADLAKLERTETLLGYTVVVQQTFNRMVNNRLVRSTGEILELDSARKERWKFEVDGTYPVDAQVIGPDRVLVTEFNGRRVTERDFKGNIKGNPLSVNGNPMTAQRLPNGNTFVVMQNRLVELDPSGAEKFSFQRPNQNHDILRARKLRNGDIVYITNQGMLSRVHGKTQKEIKSFAVGNCGNLFGSIDVLINGNVLVPQFQTHRVVEFDANGQEKWHAQVQWPTSVMRLPNGNTLVTSLNTRRVIELDHNGREVWAHQADGQVFQAQRR